MPISPAPNICKSAAQLIVYILNERYCTWVVEWHCLEWYLHPIGYVMSIFAVYRWWKGVMVLRRRWSDLTRSFASAPRLVNIPSIYTAMGVGSTSYQLVRGSMSTMRIRRGSTRESIVAAKSGVQKNEKSHTPFCRQG